MPCVAELPDLVEVAAEHADAGLQLLLVSHDLAAPGADPDVVDKVRSFARTREYTVPIRVFRGEDYEAVLDRLDLPGPIPFTAAYDANGVIVDRHEGAADRARFEAMARAALGDS